MKKKIVLSMILVVIMTVLGCKIVTDRNKENMKIYIENIK